MPTSSSDRSAEHRRQLVASLQTSGALTSDRLRDALLTVPRELFVPEFANEAGLEKVYADEAVVAKRDSIGSPISYSSPPALMTRMLELLDVRAGDNVLEIGAGTGYNAALLSVLAGSGGRVTSVEIDVELAAQAAGALAAGGFEASVVTGDGREGWPSNAPYDRIVVTAGATSVPQAWIDQLAPGGRLVVPLTLNPSVATQAIPAFVHGAGGLESAGLCCGSFVPLRASAQESFFRWMIRAEEILGAERRSLVALGGVPVRRLDALGRGRLLAVAGGDRRAEPLGARARAGGLHLFLALAGSPEELVSARLGDDPSTLGSVGVVGPGGRSLALVEAGEEVERLLCFGERDAEARLVALLDGWRAVGCPSEHDLVVRVEPNGSGPRRAATRLSFAWSSPRETG